ncbi:MAG: peptide ABC transporter substrate-binding protein [Anaerolineae bacterium]|nr:peptide ABC transporter substrate-binding protein [Anaerolineae bacterium]
MFRNKAVVLLVVLALLLTTVGVVGAQEEEEKVLRLNMGPSDVPTLDPSLATDTSSHQIIGEIFVPLGRGNEITGETETGMATWTIEETADGTQMITFTIMEGISWVKYNPETDQVEQVLDENGEVRYVTANDIYYALMRTLDPKTASDYAYVLVDAVKGAKEYNQANLDEVSEEDMAALRDAVAAKVLDDYTLQVETPNTAAFNIDILAGMWFSGAQPQWVIDAQGDFWSEPENIESYGPYALEYWYHESGIGIVANPFWPGTDTVPQPKVTRVQWVFLQDTPAFANYESGLLDVVAPPLSEMDRIKADSVLSEELYISPYFCTYYYGFNVTKPPLDNVHLRRALSFAIDRQDLVDNVTKGGQEPARWFARPGLLAAPTMETDPELGIGYDPDMAQEELALALEELGLEDLADLPPITLMHNESEGHARIAQAIQEMWRAELDLEVQIATQEWGVYLDTLDEDSPQIWRLGWCNDYFDADNFTRGVFRSDSGNNHTQWSNAEFDALVDEAAFGGLSTEERRELYVKAESILTYEDAAIVPLYWYTTVSLTKPYIERTYALTGAQRFEKWDILDH